MLWRKIRRGLSAGRVQSAALKLICDREKIIRDFIPKEYWTISATLEKTGDNGDADSKKKQFTAKLVEYKGKKFTIDNKEQSDAAIAAVDRENFIVKNVELKERVKNPLPPFYNQHPSTGSLKQTGLLY